MNHWNTYYYLKQNFHVSRCTRTHSPFEISWIEKAIITWYANFQLPSVEEIILPWIIMALYLPFLRRRSLFSAFWIKSPSKSRIKNDFELSCIFAQELIFILVCPIFLSASKRCVSLTYAITLSVWNSIHFDVTRPDATNNWSAKRHHPKWWKIFATSKTHMDACTAHIQQNPQFSTLHMLIVEHIQHLQLNGILSLWRKDKHKYLQKLTSGCMCYTCMYMCGGTICHT